MSDHPDHGPEGELERFAVDCALQAAWRTELWIPTEPEFGFVDYFEAAATRNLSLLQGFEDLAADVNRRGILCPPESDQARLVTDGGGITTDPDATALDYDEVVSDD